MAIIGIDLGTTNSLAVAYLEDHYVMIPNQYGEFLTPSVVSIEDDGSVIVGKSAKERLVTMPNKSTSLFKRKMGKKTKVTLGNREYLPQELSALVVKQLVQDAKQFLKEDIEEIVISVPAYFNEYQRSATKQVGELLGIKVERLINEPSAAALACHQGHEEDEAFIVFDFGGGTLDVSVVDCFDNVVSICSIAGNNHLGGSDFDMLIAQDFCENHQFVFGKLNNKHKESLLLQCERAKIELQKEKQSDIILHGEKQEYCYTITQERLKGISYEIFEKIKHVVAEAVNNSGFEKGEIDKMVLVGGSCHMPVVVDYLKSLMNIDVVEVEDMDQVVAMGLGTYIGIKQRKEAVKQLVLTDICPFSLGTGVHNDVDPENPIYSVLIPRNTVLPASKSSLYTTVEKGQTSITFPVYQGEAMYAKENNELASYTIPIPENKLKQEAVKVTFSYDINSLLCVEIFVISTKETKCFYVGEHNHQDLNVDVIKNVSMKLNLEPEFDYVDERINRILEESPTQRQEQIKEYYLGFIHLKHKYMNNLRKKAQLLQKIKEQLDELEKQSSTCEFFDLEENDEGKGWLS